MFFNPPPYVPEVDAVLKEDERERTKASRTSSAICSPDGEADGRSDGRADDGETADADDAGMRRGGRDRRSEEAVARGLRASGFVGELDTVGKGRIVLLFVRV